MNSKWQIMMSVKFKQIRLVSSIVIAFAICFTFGPRGYSQTGILGKKPTFGAIISNALESRAGLVSGQFDYKMSAIGPGDTGVLWLQEGSYFFDDRLEKSLHVYTRTIKESARSDRRVVGGGLFARAPQQSFVILENDSVGQAVISESDRSVSVFKPFEFRAFGFAMYGDVVRKTPFDKVLLNHLAVDDSNVSDVTGDDISEVTTSGEGILAFNFGGNVLAINTLRDWWPVDARWDRQTYKKLTNNRWAKDRLVLENSCDMELTQSNEKWVPKKVLYASRSGKFDIEFQWSSVNADVALADVDDLKLIEDVTNRRIAASLSTSP